MDKALRIIVSLVFIVFAIAVFTVAFALLPNVHDDGAQFLILFVPTVLFGIALLTVGWSIVTGMKWRDIIENILFLWR